MWNPRSNMLSMDKLELYGVPLQFVHVRLRMAATNPWPICVAPNPILVSPPPMFVGRIGWTRTIFIHGIILSSPVTKKSQKDHPNPIIRDIHSLLYKSRTRKVWWTRLAPKRWLGFRAFNVSSPSWWLDERGWLASIPSNPTGFVCIPSPCLLQYTKTLI